MFSSKQIGDFGRFVLRKLQTINHLSDRGRILYDIVIVLTKRRNGLLRLSLIGNCGLLGGEFLRVGKVVVADEV